MKYRLFAIFPFYLTLFCVGPYLATMLRNDFDVPPARMESLWNCLAYFVGIKFAIWFFSGEWKSSFRYTTLKDLLYSGTVVTSATLGVLIANSLVFDGVGLNRSVIVIDWGLSLLAIFGARSLFRIWNETLHTAWERRVRQEQSLGRALIYGMDHQAISLARVIACHSREYNVVGFVSGERRPPKSLLCGVPVRSLHRGWSRLVQEFRVEHLLIPAQVPGRIVRDLVSECRTLGIQTHIIPDVHDLVGGRFQLKTRDVEITDLLRREPNRLDLEGIRGYVRGETVLVTGGAGSIGSELCRQLSQLRPKRLVIVDQSELGVFTIEQEFKSQIVPTLSGSVDLHFVIADVTDRQRLQQVFATHEPTLVFHAAAYKHVPLMEESPYEAIRNNVLGTKTVADLAHETGVTKFVLISTDKAVRPTSVMGSTKLLAEKYVQGRAADSQTEYIAVRFGNVLNSAGSVIPTFRRQIERGGPITVTHPDMVRFFMTIPEAVQLVLQAGSIGRSGDILILDMGEPVRIVDLARDMITLSGLRCPDDIEVVFSGIRPGEKLYEELFYGTEQGAKRIHDKIFQSNPQSVRFQTIQSEVTALFDRLGEPAENQLQGLWDLVHRYVEAGETDGAGPDVPVRKVA